MVATVHDPWYHLGDLPPLRHAWLICKVQEWCSQLIVHGWQLAQNLITGMGMDERLINVVPHGNYDIYLQAKWIPPLSVPVPGRVLFFGRMLKYKGLDVLVQAAKLVAGKVPTLKIVLAGRGEELDRLQPQLQSNSHLVWPKLVANAAKKVLRSLLGPKKGFRTSAELLNLMHPFLLADGTRFRSGHRSSIAQISKDKLRRESWYAGDEFDSLLFQRWCSART